MMQLLHLKARSFSEWAKSFKTWYKHRQTILILTYRMWPRGNWPSFTISESQREAWVVTWSQLFVSLTVRPCCLGRSPQDCILWILGTHLLLLNRQTFRKRLLHSKQHRYASVRQSMPPTSLSVGDFLPFYYMTSDEASILVLLSTLERTHCLPWQLFPMIGS